MTAVILSSGEMIQTTAHVMLNLKNLFGLDFVKERFVGIHFLLQNYSQEVLK